MAEEKKQQEKAPAKEAKPKAEAKKAPAKTKAAAKGGKIAVILLRSLINIKPDIRKTLDLLKLRSRNICVIIDDTPSSRGMLQVVKDYTTWGVIDAATEKELVAARGQTDVEGKTKPFFKLNSPKKGYGRKGIKVPFTMGGALGDRKEAVNDLIKRMI